MKTRFIMFNRAGVFYSEDTVSTSPPHAGFEPWYGLVAGPLVLTPAGYAAFVLKHHLAENDSVFYAMETDVSPRSSKPNASISY